jgi:hypothetical protein
MKNYGGERERMSNTLGNKIKAAYENGRLDFLAGAPCDPNTPLVVYDNLSSVQQAVIKQAWADGWSDESLKEMTA